MLLLFIKAKIKLPDDSMLLSLKKTHKPNKTKSTNQKKKKKLLKLYFVELELKSLDLLTMSVLFITEAMKAGTEFSV